MQTNKPGGLDWTLLIILTGIWGFSYYFIKHSLESFNPTQVASLRMVIGAIALLPFLPQALRLIPLKLLGVIFFVGLVGSFMPAFLYPFAQQKISSSLAGIINAFTPICTFGIGVLFFKVKNEKAKFLGTLIALFGAFSLILLKPNATLRAETLYLLVAFSVPFLYGINSNTIKAKLGSIPGIPMTAAMYISLLVLSLPIAYWSGGLKQIPIAIASGNAFYHLVALSVLGSALAMAIFNVLIQRVHVLFAASVTYLMPLVALVVGWFDGEQLSWNDIFGLGCILIGVLIMNGVLRRTTE
ncbi:MAG: EamA family transporter [Saprospiraceae bacterium]|nr:EamA family transporter [Saprospiraceae bacterium]